MAGKVKERVRKPTREVEVFALDEGAEEDSCIVCELEDNDDGEPLASRLAYMMAYGEIVVAGGVPFPTCDAHDRMLKAAEKRVRSEID